MSGYANQGLATSDSDDEGSATWAEAHRAQVHRAHETRRATLRVRAQGYAASFAASLKFENATAANDSDGNLELAGTSPRAPLKLLSRPSCKAAAVAEAQRAHSPSAVADVSYPSRDSSDAAARTVAALLQRPKTPPRENPRRVRADRASSSRSSHTASASATQGLWRAKAPLGNLTCFMLAKRSRT